MKPKTHLVLRMCIENGIALGWNRAHKHTDNPSPEQIRDAIQHAIETEIYEWFDMESKDE